MADRTALVVGARGVVGTNLIEHLAADGGWDVIGLSRRGGAGGPGVRHIAADLLDPAAMGDIAAELAGVTHVVLCRLPGPADVVRTRGAKRRDARRRA